jgi:hypothetical protein
MQALGVWFGADIWRHAVDAVAGACKLSVFYMMTWQEPSPRLFQAVWVAVKWCLGAGQRCSAAALALRL